MALFVKRLGTGLVTLGILWLAMALFASPAWAQAVLSVNKTGNPRTVVQGENVTYTVNVTNRGDAIAEGVTLTDDLPDVFDFVSADDRCVPAPTGTSPEVTCELGPLGEGETATVNIVATARGLGDFTNEATATSTTGVASASDTATTTVVPNLVINKLDDPGTVQTGELLRYTLRITNQGSGDADTIVVNDELPLENVRYVSVSSSPEIDGCREVAGLIRCTGGTIPSGDSARVEIIVRPFEPGDIQNTATVGVAGFETIATDTEGTTVVGDAVAPDPTDPPPPEDGTDPPPEDPGTPDDPGELEPEPLDPDPGPLAGGTAIGRDVLVPGDQNCGPDGQFVCIDQIVIEAENCELIEGETPTVTVRDPSGPFRLRDGDNVDFSINEDGTIVLNGRETLGETFPEGQRDNPNRVIIPIPVDPENFEPDDQPNDTFPIISSTGIGGEGCRAVGASSDERSNEVIEDSIPDTDLPETSGFPLALTVGSFLLAGGSLLGLFTLRRRY